MRALCLPAAVCCTLLALTAAAGEANRLTYLDEFCDPYYVGRDFPKLTTPQWAGEEGVEAVVVLAIDDMRDTGRYEAYLRPILDRLKQIDGRAPVSIMTCNVDPADPQLRTWIDEGLSIECHTVDHPCPLLQGGDFGKAKSTYDRCVDLLNEIPGNRPVAFRMPCCDSRNTPSPRFWVEIFNRTTGKGNYLEIDSSVFNITTPHDRQLPRALTVDADGRERFRKYLPFPSFVNTIEDYPYPYVIGRLCWEFPCIVPSDWEAQNLQQPNNPRTVEDLKAALDAVVIKQGTFNLVFHPHGWIRSDQIVELIDHAVEQHGGKVKFLTFREALERINQHLLAGFPLRGRDGGDNGVRLLDLNNDGYLDVLLGTGETRRTRVWMPAQQRWAESEFPYSLRAGDGVGEQRPVHFGVTRPGGPATLVTLDELRQFTGSWTVADASAPSFPQFPVDSGTAATAIRLRDLQGDGVCEILISNGESSHVFQWNDSRGSWEKATFGLPVGTQIVDRHGRDAGLRFVDVDGDGFDDVIFSNGARYSLHLFESIQKGWSGQVIAAARGREGAAGPAIPMIVRSDGTNNGVWFHSRTMWVQNEDTHRLPDGVDRLSFDEMLGRR